jgi:hypothetical protein
MMKSKFHISTITVLIIGFVFLSGLNTQAQKKRRTIPKASTLSLAGQAEEQARAFWNNRITKCGEDYYTLDSIYVHQFKTINIQVQSYTITPADRLNGIEYKGLTTLTVGQSRTYSRKNTSYQATGWTKWADGFTMSMGGVGLNATLQKQKRQWNITANSMTQAGSLKQISCSDAANPSEFYRRLEEQAYGADVKAFRDKAPSMGIYTKNIPPEMWKALYQTGGFYGYYTTVSWVYLAQNGGWGVAGRNGYQSADLLSVDDWKLVNGRWIEQVTKDGGWIFVNRGYAKREYVTKNIPEVLEEQLTKFYNQKLYIRKVRIGYNGEWFVLAENAGGAKFWSWYNVPESADKAFEEIENNRKYVSDVAFLPNGGYIILYDRNGCYYENLPDDASRVIEMLRTNDHEISQVTFGPDDSWIIRANGTW